MSDGIVAWLDPSDPETLELSGSEILKIKDLSGRKNDFIQYKYDGGLATPSYDPTGINNLGTIRFDTNNYIYAENDIDFNSLKPIYVYRC